MNVFGRHYRTIWLKPDDPQVVQIIDQRHLPHQFVIEDLNTVADVARAIKDMHVRGAGLIGVAAAYGMVLAALHAPRHTAAAFMAALRADGDRLKATRPTAVNLEWAVTHQLAAIEAAGPDIEAMLAAAHTTAAAIANEDANFCRRIGQHGLPLIEEISRRKRGQTVNILTHCNAGWLAFVDYGTATAPIYAAHDQGLKVHVWVDETRPRNQGARLTAWELGHHGVPHSVIVDNVGGHLMQHGLVDLVITGTDRTTYTGDVANKIGTYLKALAAYDNGVPFYVALPSSTFDWQMRDGMREIPIEQRDAAEVRHISGLYGGQEVDVLLTPANSPAANYAFDVTPARLVTGLITERGICPATEEGILGLYPEKKPGGGQ
jgi:methylthioribose-1-phosphate isomerase